VNDANEKRAIQLILEMVSDYGPSPVPQLPGYRFWLYFGLGGLLLLTFNFPPKGAIGIWDGKRKLEGQRAWLRFVSITVPLAIFSALVAELVHVF
jgi:hypothetical protein